MKEEEEEKDRAEWGMKVKEFEKEMGALSDAREKAAKECRRWWMHVRSWRRQTIMA